MSISTIHLLLRITTRASGSVFLLAFVAPDLHSLWNWVLSRVLYATRTGLFLLFVLLHTVHLAFIVVLARTVGRGFFAPPQLAGILLGGLVYLLIYGLGVGALDRNHRIPVIRSAVFQSVASYIIWFAFAVAYTASVIPYPALAPLVAASYIALAVRIAAPVAEWRNRKKSAAAA